MCGIEVKSSQFLFLTFRKVVVLAFRQEPKNVWQVFWKIAQGQDAICTS